MTNPAEKIHRIFFDNSIFKEITKKNNEAFHNHLYDSITTHIPSLDNGLYKTNFSWFSYLEAIGLGNFQEKKPTFSFNAEDLLKCTNLEEKLTNDFERATEWFYTHTDLKPSQLIIKAEKTLQYRPNQVTGDLVNDTIKRYTEELQSNSNEATLYLAHRLAWNLICSLLILDNIAYADRAKLLHKLKQTDEWLLRTFHDMRAIGVDLDSHRLFTRIQYRLMQDPEYLNGIDRADLIKKNLKMPNLIQNEKDLCDTEIIHYATFGLLRDGKSQPVIILTGDSLEKIRERLSIQKSVIEVLTSIKDSQISECNGWVYQVALSTGLIIGNPIDVSQCKSDFPITVQFEDQKKLKKKPNR